MKLHFSQNINGKPTYFIEKIWNGLLQEKFNLLAYHRFRSDAALIDVLDQWDIPKSKTLKITTIRRDSKNRWKPKALIHFITNFRGVDTFHFAPVLPVVSTQSFEIKYHENTFLVYIDDKLFFFGNRDFSVNEFENYHGMLELVNNDGFETIEDFCAYFSENYVGKIIHWTNLKY